MPSPAAERTAAIDCAEVLRDMAGRIDSPSAAGSYLSEKGLRAVDAVIRMLDVVTAGDDEWRKLTREWLRNRADYHLS